MMRTLIFWALGLLSMQACSLPTYVFNPKMNILYVNAHNPIIITKKRFHIDTDNGKLVREGDYTYIIPTRVGKCKIYIRRFGRANAYDFRVKQIDTSYEKLVFFLGPRSHFEAKTLENLKRKRFLTHTWDNDYEMGSEILGYNILILNGTDTILAHENIGQELNPVVIEAFSKLDTSDKIILKDIKLGFDNNNTIILNREEVFW